MFRSARARDTTEFLMRGRGRETASGGVQTSMERYRPEMWRLVPPPEFETVTDVNGCLFQSFISVLKAVFCPAGLSSIDPTKSRSLRKVLIRRRSLRSQHEKLVRVRNDKNSNTQAEAEICVVVVRCLRCENACQSSQVR